MPTTKTSITGKSWIYNEPDARQVLMLIQRHNISDILARILVNRQIASDDVESYLNPTLRHFLPDPNHLIDMEKAVARTLVALNQKQSIVVYGDYDVDGATSSAVLRRYFELIGHPIGVYIPDRIDEGYGANSEALLMLRAKPTDLILMVDCGTTAFDPLATAAEAGLDVIVLDHHTAETTLPITAALVNPNRLDQPPLPRDEMRFLCAAGVAYMFVVALNRSLRKNGYFVDKPEPDLKQLLDLVALGTVCDVMPLIGLNRAFVRQGLKIMATRSNIGLSTLADIAKVSEKPSAYHLGFALGPRVNAGGRVGDAMLGSHLLSTGDDLLAKQIASRLDSYNEERQGIERFVLEQALNQIELKNLNEHPILLISGEGWHPGVIGIVASRLKERFHKPAMVVAFDENIGKGSGRSVAGVIMGEAMIKAVQLGLLAKGGGHAMAAGFTVMRDQYDAFYTFLNAELGDKARSSLPTLIIDSSISIGGATLAMITELQTLEPFGAGNPQPRFIIKNVTMPYAEPIGDGSHFRCRIQDETGAVAKLMAFRVTGTPVEAALKRARTEMFDVAVTLKNDTFGGRNSITLMLEDMAF
ncbi:MAG: single-stranded-DNA-specific exonuclease RecJ [Candidatus Paracaedibacteraceae bacterium]|nr:single-stranded-DNA-specific exonuclease RecJ [Candidatus Paracaedibacteraceae bacterium]